MRRLMLISGVLFLLTLPQPASAVPAGSIVGLPAWDAVPTPSQGLLGIDAVSPTDIWAVGGRSGRTLVEHSNGAAFDVVRSPSRSGRTNILEDVAGVAQDDVWAVGHSDVTDFVGALTLTEHWDGSRWRVVKTPNVGDQETQNELTGVAAVAPDDVWAVGSATDFHPGGTPLILHWNGSRWTSVRNDCGTGLTEVDARGPGDVWAVGGAGTCHWNGTVWKDIPAASDPTGQAGIDLRDVAIVGPRNVWAVGIAYFSCGEGQVCPVGEIQHWTGGPSWHHVIDGVPILYGVTAIASNDIYAVGLGIGPAILHFDGASWSKVPSGFDVGVLQAVDAAAPSDLWAAGSGGGNPSRSLVEHAPSATSGAVAGGSNVGGATISWFGKESGSVETDPFGDYQVGGLPAGRYTFTATYAGCGPDSAHVRIVAGTIIGRDFHIDCGEPDPGPPAGDSSFGSVRLSYPARAGEVP
jgi:Carboxypeptidase regulatory-like domain